MRKCLYIYAWDFLDEGIDEVLGRIKSLGMDSIAMAVSYHAGKFLLPHNPNHRVYFPEDGTVYFIPRLDYYHGPVKPKPASILKSGNVLASAAEKCRQFDLKLTAWTVCMHNTRLGLLHPELTVKNAYGDHYQYCLCPAQSQTEEYILGLINDLVDNYDLDTIFLESLGYMPFPHGFHHEIYGIRPDKCQNQLLSLCFCEACRAMAAKAGIDVDRVVELVHQYTDPIFISDARTDSCDISELIESNPELVAYLEMRCEVTTDLLEQIKRIADKRNVEIDYFAPGCEAFVEGTDIAEVMKTADRYVIPVWSPSIDIAREDIDCVMSKVSHENIILSINMSMDSTPTEENFREKVGLACHYDLAGINFYNYSTLPFARLNWLNHIKLVDIRGY